MQSLRPLNAADGVLRLIGDTPLVEITRLDRGCCRLFVKLEGQNPGGSIKDRPALSMVTAFERDGWPLPTSERVITTSAPMALR
jgi:cystathionine beta-synthase